ncbi:MAG TPA: bifunctional YncE family protein/alkaline phosphatase family protein [Chloroflexota bacterium]|nr:bifunctional YncE family protein/alkaline phosphatase family protein [Chloroflexota bacterium]
MTAVNTCASVARAAIGVLLVGSTFAGAAGAQTPPITSQGWTLTPAGRQVALGDRPLSLALSPDGRTLLVGNDGQSTQSLMVVDRQSGTVVQTIPYAAPEALFLGVAFSPDGKHAFASAGGNNKIRTYDVGDQQLVETESLPLPTTNADGKKINPYPAGLAVAADGSTLFIANNLDDSVSLVDVAGRTVRTMLPVGHNPYAVVLSEDGREVYVSNWGEQSVAVVDGAGSQVLQRIAVGTHPSAMVLSAARHELYVANTDSDTISVIDTTSHAVVRTISLAPYAGAQQGSSPDGLALDGDTLYVANAGNSDIAVVHLGAPDEVRGLIPTAWYPTAVAVAPDGGEVYVVNAKGLGTGPNGQAGPNPYKASTPASQYVASMAVGSLSIVPAPEQAELDRYTQQVVTNNGFDERAQVRVVGPDQTVEQVVPRRPGDPSPIKHVIYVIRENRTYDQVLGSLGRGNGDASLNLFDDASAPNTRELARRFVTLDNFYADAEVSADGWNWSTAAEANTYVQKNWPANYSTGRNRPYDFEGGNLSTAPGPVPENAYIWDRLDSAGVSYRNYGFWIASPGRVASTAPKLGTHTDLAYPGYDLAVSDQTRMDEWLNEFKGFMSRGDLPTVELVRLPNDHTAGTRPGSPTPRAYMADNDYALGRLVDAVSHSPVWPETAIFVLEDDAQNGPDHVDAHRTVALVISPYTQTGTVDSTFYSTSSTLRTIELIVGLAPMTQFDSAATPLLASFTDAPKLDAYTALVPAQPLDEQNTAASPMSAQSAAMDFSVEDRAPEQALNEAIWQSVRGADSSMPPARTAFRERPAELDTTMADD